MSDPVIDITPLSNRWQTHDPFLFCVHHIDLYPKGNDQFGPSASLAGHEIGQDFEARTAGACITATSFPVFRSIRIAASRR
jgi:hypothetical protein